MTIYPERNPGRPDYEKWNPEEIELEKRYLEILEEFCRTQLVNNLGSRSLPAEKIKELVAYWVSSIIPFVGGVRDKLERRKLSLQQLCGLEKSEILQFFLNRMDTRKAGLESYSDWLGEDLTQVIQQQANSRSEPVRILDIGCADGVFLQDCMKRFPMQVLPSGIAIRNEGAERRPGIDFRTCLAEVMPENFGERFDLTISVNATMYFIDPEMAFNEALRGLQKDGWLYYGHGTLKPEQVKFDVMGKMLNGMSEDEIISLFVGRHKMFWERAAYLVEEATFSKFNRQFEVKEMKWKSSQPWTDIAMRVIRKD